ncbi:hypothetical protein BDW59DRAFT_157147 [Aspergillus cavernicola]|uniref:Terpenoid cyclases/protein prenyltransferase alpha-alpha toroid n=1 Tax=Aspergillus cavernicola TaxID=176166 RepID=A0ABR4IZD9_9EURO
MATSMPTTQDLSQRATKLVHRIATAINTDHGVSSMAYSIYDTAWVSMIIKTGEKGPGWLFPECFDFLLKEQRSSGEWSSFSAADLARTPSSDILIPDILIHTLAGLLALCLHSQNRDCINGTLPYNILGRISRAKESANAKLQKWKVSETKHFGFQLLIPVLLQRLKDEQGISFSFPGEEELLSIYNAARQMDIEWLYTEKCSVPLLCYEGFLGKIDFARISHQISAEGLGALPASTAAYLLYAPIWSNECEEYLRNVIYNGSGQGTGGVAPIFPLTIFESSWVLTTLLENGFSTHELGKDNVDTIIRFLSKQLDLNGGRVGATTTWVADADDTGRALTALYLHGYNPSLDSLISNHEVDTYFQTFFGRIPNAVPSISVNSNVLNALLSSPEPPEQQIIKCVKYLCESWGNDIVCPGDHWNTSEYYAILHMSFSLVKFRIARSWGILSTERKVMDMVDSTLSKCREYTLKTQNEDGSWGKRHSSEESAYAVLVLANLLKLDGTAKEQRIIRFGIESGKRYLARWKGPDPSDLVWTGKVWLADLFIQEAYVLAALRVNISPFVSSGQTSKL